MVCMALAGRAAEQVFFGRVTTGAADDLRRVTQIVYQMVQVYGMNERVGQVSFPREEGQFGPADRLYSNATSELIDEEVKAIVAEAYTRTLKLVEERREQVRLVAELLLEKETITNNDVAGLIGKRPHGSNKEYEEYASSGWGASPSESPAAEPAAEVDKDASSGSGSDGGATLSPAFYKDPNHPSDRRVQ
jgi:AFG3 family protein